MIERGTGRITIQSFPNIENPSSEEVNQIPVKERHDSETTMNKPVTKEKIEEVVHGMNEFLATSNTHLKFEFHDKLKEYYVTIVDNRTEEIIKEIPAKKVLDMHVAMTEFVGLLVDKKV